MSINNLVKVEGLTKTFFESMGGKLVGSRCIKIQTYSSQNSKIPCVNYYISFGNKDIFGRGNFSDEVYPRYRKIRSDWKNVLEKSGVVLYRDIAVGFIPLLDSNKIEKNKQLRYEKECKKPLGSRILSIASTNSDYYNEMAEKFGIRFVLKESGGMLIGPERGMMYVLEAVKNIFKKIDCFVDIGAGTGELSAYVLKNCNPQKIVVNEISQKLRVHLKNYLEKIALSSKAKIVFSFQDCQEMNFPSKVDLISMGVFYGIQPSLIKHKGAEIAKSLGKSGLLLVQSSMPETLFSQHILMGDLGGVNKWPWYSEKFILLNYFSCVKSFFIDNQFITLASQSSDSVNRIIMKLDKKVVPYAHFE